MTKKSMARTQAGAKKKKDSVTKKEIVKQIAESLGETQLRTKEIVQRTFEAIVDTLLKYGRIELRNFGVFEVKRRKARKARNPRTGDRVDVPPKNVVTFKPGKEMEERVRRLTHIPTPIEIDEDDDSALDETPVRKPAPPPTLDSASNGDGTTGHTPPKRTRARKSS